MPDPAREVETQAFAQVLREELERRLGEYATYTDDTFGTITLTEAVITTMAYGLLPVVVLWLFA